MLLVRTALLLVQQGSDMLQIGFGCLLCLCNGCVIMPHAETTQGLETLNPKSSM